MLKKVVYGLLTLYFSSCCQAASINEIWEPLKNQFTTYQLIDTHGVKPFYRDANFTTSSDYALALLNQTTTQLKDKTSIKHYRYQQYYKQLPIYGFQVSFHYYPNQKSMVTGFLVKNIDKDITSIKTNLSHADIWQSIKNKLNPDLHIKFKQINKVIYIKDDHAHLAYHVYYYSKKGITPAIPHMIIDANTGKVLKAWNALKTARIGQGPGGTTGQSSPIGPWTYSINPSGNNVFGPIEVKSAGGNCVMKSQYFRIFDLGNTRVQKLDIPAYILNENTPPYNNLFTYACGADNRNTNDNGTAPINRGQSPNNDAMFFAQMTQQMFQRDYGLANPFGPDLPVRIYTHINEFDNAFAASTERLDGTIVIHNSLYLGNGDIFFFPLTQGTVAHELGHIITDQYSKLEYEAQSGGINEAFSDMVELAVQDYLRRLGFAWFWSGSKTSYTIGANETQNGRPLRYLYKPSLDNRAEFCPSRDLRNRCGSIDSAKDYYTGIDVHWSSGVYNRAFFYLSTLYDFGPQATFRIMFDANRSYWTQNSTFDYAACGVIQSAYDRKMNFRAVINAFKNVGVNCRTFSVDKQVV